MTEYFTNVIELNRNILIRLKSLNLLLFVVVVVFMLSHMTLSLLSRNNYTFSSEKQAALTNGFSLIGFDFSGSGNSDGEHISLGWWERDDVETIARYLRESGTVSHVCGWGRSMGAATCLMYSARAKGENELAAIVTDSPFADLWQLVRMADMCSLFRSLFRSLFFLFVSRLFRALSSLSLSLCLCVSVSLSRLFFSRLSLSLSSLSLSRLFLSSLSLVSFSRLSLSRLSLSISLNTSRGALSLSFSLARPNSNRFTHLANTHTYTLTHAHTHTLYTGTRTCCVHRAQNSFHCRRDNQDGATTGSATTCQL